MEPSDTTVLRKAAPDWSLAGDKHLLQVLEQMHQKIISKCQEVNTKLDEMVNTLDNASIDLQNVNNKFMALSNSQFVESRVYDDDVISDVDSEKKTAPPVDQESEVSKVKRSLQTLEAMHETVRILDSDSSDDDDNFRTILKPHDRYASRPLPYIIDSLAWRTKWHVGLVPSDSESDSSTEFFKNEVPREQYSESESEDEPNQQTGRDISSNSEVESEPSPATRPADIAAQIAKRLTAQRPILLEPEPREEPVPETVPRKVYRAEPLVPATVFSDEPPPLEQSDGDYSDDDIFAELHKKPTASRQQNRPRGFESRNVVDDLFGDQLFDDESKIEEVRSAEKVKTGAKDTILYEENLDSNLFTPEEVTKPKSQIAPTEQATKKPIGGMSLFGSSKGAESIGAAILKRNQRKSSSSEEDNFEVEEHKQTVSNKKSAPDATNKIIEDLFFKPKSNKKGTEIYIEDDKSQEKEKPVKAKIDLFSDNIFDDVDDIFTTEVVTKPKESLKGTKKSIFDEDELFADIPIKTSVNNNNKDSLFDSDDELFKEDNLNVDGDKNLKGPSISKTAVTKGNEPHRERSTEESIFGDDNDEIFGASNSHILQNQTNATNNVNTRASPSWSNRDDLEDPVIRRDKLKDSKNYTRKESIIENIINESEDLCEPKLSNIITSSESKQTQSPLLFGEDEIDDLFIKNSKQIESSKDRTKDIFIKENKERNIFDNSMKNEGVVTESKSQNNKFVEHIEQEANNNNLDVKHVGDNNEEITNSQIANEQFSVKKHEEDEIKSVSAENTALKYNVTEQINFNTDDYVFKDIINSKITGAISSAVIKQENNQNDIPDDIFSDLPPAFEKPSEPKKSKNVNALFDDDSDDEALFFKKNDVTEEKPEVTYNYDRFRIFHDEPPDIDVDFSRKSKDNIANTVESHGELFNVPEQLVNNELISEQISHKPKENELTSHTNKERKTLTQTQICQKSEDNSLNISKLLDSVNIETDNDKLGDKTVETKEDYKSNVTPENDTIDRETNARKSIGKLKPMNININVNSLLPGASPTKQKPKDESDGLVFSTKSNEEINKFTTQKEESKIVKSVSFDNDPESNILNNQLSKGRAKIQVKRRPSSRRARLEAVRKSGIDFADDSTDNSGSFDEPGPKIDAIDIAPETTSTDSINNYNEKDQEEEQSKRQIKIVRNDDKKSTDKKLDTVQNIVNTETKSKTIYILHDEDIFADSSVTHVGTSKKTLTILDDDDELFKNTISKSLKNDEELNTQKPLEDKTRTLAIVDSDDELFKNPISKVTKNDVESNTQKSLQDKTKTLKILDNDDELFKNPISKSVKNEVESNTQKLEDKVNENNGAKEKPNTSVKSKKSIFDDLSDDDDELFGGKKSSGISLNNDIIYKKSKTDNTKVLDKPKSLFGDDSDDDLFKTGKSSDVKPTKTKETTSTVSKPVINDPLSLFDDS